MQVESIRNHPSNQGDLEAGRREGGPTEYLAYVTDGGQTEKELVKENKGLSTS